MSKLELPADAQLGDVVDHLRRSDAKRGWRSVHVEYVRSGQARPYADSVGEYLITFSGGTPSSEPGWELAFATMPPYDKDDIFNRNVVGANHDRRKLEHNDRIKKVCRSLTGWSYDKTINEQGHHGLETRLDSFTHVRGDKFSNTYRLVIVSPYCD